MNDLIIVRGGGDLATGTIYKLKKSGFRVLILEVSNPSAIRRNVAFCEAVYQGSQTVEDMTCHLAVSLEQAEKLLGEGKLVTLVVEQARQEYKEGKTVSIRTHEELDAFFDSL